MNDKDREMAYKLWQSAIPYEEAVKILGVAQNYTPQIAPPPITVEISEKMQWELGISARMRLCMQCKGALESRNFLMCDKCLGVSYENWHLGMPLPEVKPPPPLQNPGYYLTNNPPDFSEDAYPSIKWWQGWAYIWILIGFSMLAADIFT